MNRCGIQGETLDWFKLYLTNCTQRFSVNSCLSHFATLICGVSNLYDLSNCLLFSIPRMYADDTHITYASSDLHLIKSSLSHDVEKLSN